MITIITPSYNQVELLKRCCRSVADQESPHEHLVIDGGSTDGTVTWLQQQSGLRWVSAPDRGMYDALNKGLRLAAGDVVGYLNCDEQYLPGALSAASGWLAAHPSDDLVFGDALLVQPDGTLAAYRKAYPLRWWYVGAAHLYVQSCALFFRARLASALGGFDPSWRTVGDMDFVIRALRGGARAGHLRRYLGIFTMTGQNLGASALAAAEVRAVRRRMPVWVRAARPLLNGLRQGEKVLAGAHVQRWPLDYALVDADGRRRLRSATGASFRWPE